MTTLLALFALSLAVSLVLTPVVRSVAGRCGLTDKPDGRRKLHKRVTPMAGGIAILLATLVTLGTMLAADLIPWMDQFEAHASQLLGLGVAAVLISGVGVLDDWGRLRGRHKLLGQVCAIAVVIASGTVIKSLHVMNCDIELGLLSVPFTAFFLLGAINSLNLLDGMDGLLGTVGLIVLLAFAGMAALGDKWATACIAVAMAGAVLGFLRYNFPPASIFLGDTGSMLIGLVIGSLAIRSSMKGPATVALAAPIAALALPILDTTAAIFRRKLTGRSIYTTDRGHLHHCLLRRGYSTIGVLAFFAVFSIIAVAGALLSVAFNNEWFALLSGATVASVLVGMRWFGHAETQLVFERLKTVATSLLRLRKGKPSESAVRLQGSAVWTELWSGFTESARGMNLKQVCLDINAPALHEGYNARWSNPAQDDSEAGATSWHAAIPLVLHGQTVGRCEVTGFRDEQPVWMKIASLTKLVEDVEMALCKIAEESAAGTAVAAPAPRLAMPFHRLLPLDKAYLNRRMRILFLNRSYYPDVEATGQLLTELCGDLARQHDVEVIAGLPNFVAATGGLVQRDMRDGVAITRVRNFRFTKKSLIGRAFGLLSYLVLALAAALFARRPDVIVVETDPPFLGLLGAFLKRWHRCSMIFYLQDLYPEVGITLGKLRPGLLTGFLHWATQVGLRAADRIVVLGRDMHAKVLARGIAADKIDIVPNWADTDRIRPSAEPSPLRAEWGVGNRFVVMYSGNLGLSQNLDPLLDAAADLRDAPLAFVLIGEGAAKAPLQARAATLGLANVRFLPYQPKERLGESLSAADVHYIPLRRGLAGSIVPSKLYGILAAGVPYIAAVDADSEVAHVTAEFDSGMVIAPDDAVGLAVTLRWCLAHRRQLTAMGDRGRIAAEARFSRTACVARFDSVIAKLDPCDRRPVALAAAKPTRTSSLAIPRMQAMHRLSEL